MKCSACKGKNFKLDPEVNWEPAKGESNTV